MDSHSDHNDPWRQPPRLNPVDAEGTSPFASLLRRAEKQVGTVVSSPDPVLAERLAESFDYLWIDLEHAALTVGDVQTLAIAARAGGAYALVRLPAIDFHSLCAVLDTGVDGVVAPRVQYPAEASSLVDMTTYPPHGIRGFAERRARRLRSAVKPGGWPSDTVARVVQIETIQGLANVREIAAIPGIDGLLIGTSDLSLELGCPLDLSSPSMIDAIRAVGSAAAAEGKAWGLAAGSLLPWARQAARDGASLLLLASDVRLYSQAINLCEPDMDAWRTTKTTRTIGASKDGR
jgi:4-hydroxy-2-oxoheptanedioate aldolase